MPNYSYYKYFMVRQPPTPCLGPCLAVQATTRGLDGGKWNAPTAVLTGDSVTSKRAMSCFWNGGSRCIHSTIHPITRLVVLVSQYSKIWRWAGARFRAVDQFRANRYQAGYGIPVREPSTHCLLLPCRRRPVPQHRQLRGAVEVIFHNLQVKVA